MLKKIYWYLIDFLIFFIVVYLFECVNFRRKIVIFDKGNKKSCNEMEFCVDYKQWLGGKELLKFVIVNIIILGVYIIKLIEFCF